MGVSAQSDASAALTPEIFLVTHYTVGWMGPRGSGWLWRKEKFSCQNGVRNKNHQACNCILIIRKVVNEQMSSFGKGV